MSLRPVLRAAPIARYQAARALSSSAPRRGGHDDHGHSSSSEADTDESFLTPGWTATFALIAASVLAYPYLPSTQVGAASSALSNDTLVATARNESAPWVTRQISAAMVGRSEEWAKRNDDHLEKACAVADTKLIFQEAEKPKMWRLRNRGSFENASPHSIGVGSQADLSDLKIKTRQDDQE